MLTKITNGEEPLPPYLQDTTQLDGITIHQHSDLMFKMYGDVEQQLRSQTIYGDPELLNSYKAKLSQKRLELEPESFEPLSYVL